MALSCCASTRRCANLYAVTASVRLRSRISPSGMRLANPATIVCTWALPPLTRRSTDASSPIASGMERTTNPTSSRSFARSSGERGCRKLRAVAVSRSARLCGPTAVASYSPVPSTAKEPDQTGSPGPRTESSDSPVRLASSRARPSAETRRPSATTWSPGARRTRSPTTTSSTWTWTSVPSRTTTASGATSAAS